MFGVGATEVEEAWCSLSGQPKIWRKIGLLKVYSVVSLVDGSINVLVGEELEN